MLEHNTDSGAGNNNAKLPTHNILYRNGNSDFWFTYVLNTTQHTNGCRYPPCFMRNNFSCHTEVIRRFIYICLTFNFWHLKISMYRFYMMQSMETSWYKKCDGQKPEKNKYVNLLIDSGHYILFVDTHVCTRDR